MPLTEDEKRRKYEEGVGRFGQDRVDEFLRTDPDDYDRISTALTNETGYRPFDSQSSNPDEQAANRAADEARQRQPDTDSRGSGTSGSGGGSNAYQSYLQPQQPQQDPMLARLVAQMEADRARMESDRVRQEQERAEMRGILMSQLGEATQPVSADSPTIRPLINAQSLALQRSAQRQRSADVERAGMRGLGDSGALDTRVNQIEQGRGEAEAGMTAQIMSNELNAKRQQVISLLDLAARSGDTAAARTLQGQLTTLDQQLQQNRFTSDLGFRERAFDTGESSQRYRFDNDMAYRLAQLQLMGNQGSMGFLNGLM